MTVKNVSNLAASVQARLQNHARATKRPFQELLQYYAMERFLYRLSTTPHRARFVLKGALMLHVWDAPLARATKDLDFLGRLDNSLENLERVVRQVCTADVEPELDRYGASELDAAIAVAMERGAYSAQAVAHLCNQRRRARNAPVPIIAEHHDPRVRDLRVLPHALEGYDALAKGDDDEEDPS